MILIRSIENNPIRLTQERLEHILLGHPELDGQIDKIVDTVQQPDLIQLGDHGTRLAIRLFPKTPLTQKYLVVVYREIEDGFVLTAYFTSKPAQWRTVLWKR